MSAHPRLRWVAPALIALASTAAAQTTTLKKDAAPAPKAAQAPAAPRPDPAKMAEVLATVDGQRITRGDVVSMLSQFQIPAGKEQQAYDGAIEMLVNAKLLAKFLEDQKVVVSPAEVAEGIKQEEERLKKNNTSLAEQMEASGMTRKDVEERLTQRLRWRNYILGRATKAELRNYLQRNKEALDGTKVAARHILLEVEPDAPEAKKEEVKQKLLSIKKEIDSKAIGFADAANKYSQDPGNVQTPNGGDVGYFNRRGQFIEEFADAAFKMKKGEISDPILTDYGWHLIQVTDRRPGQPIDFDQYEDRIKELYADDTMETVVANARKTAKIDVKPMPADLFPKLPDAPAAAPAATGATPKAR